MAEAQTTDVQTTDVQTILAVLDDAKQHMPDADYKKGVDALRSIREMLETYRVYCELTIMRTTSSVDVDFETADPVYRIGPVRDYRTLKMYLLPNTVDRVNAHLRVCNEVDNPGAELDLDCYDLKTLETSLKSTADQPRTLHVVKRGEASLKTYTHTTIVGLTVCEIA